MPGVRQGRNQLFDLLSKKKKMPANNGIIYYKIQREGGIPLSQGDKGKKRKKGGRGATFLPITKRAREALRRTRLWGKVPLTWQAKGAALPHVVFGNRKREGYRGNLINCG